MVTVEKQEKTGWAPAPLSCCALVFVALALLSGCRNGQCPNPSADSWRVYRGDTLVLTGNSTSGSLLSTAHPPPSGPPTHPFITAQAHDTTSEHELRGILNAATDADDFLRRLCSAGFRVESSGGD